MRKQGEEWRRKNPEKFKKSVERSWKRRRELGHRTTWNMTTVVVCKQCDKHIKGRYGGLGRKAFRGRAIKCPYCRFLYRKGEEIEVIRVKRTDDYKGTIQLFNRWDVYRHLPDVSEHLESLPEKIETTEELRKRVKIRPLAREAFEGFDKRRDRITAKRVKHKTRRIKRIENRIAKSLRYYGEWFKWETRLTPSR